MIDVGPFGLLDAIRHVTNVLETAAVLIEGNEGVPSQHAVILVCGDKHVHVMVARDLSLTAAFSAMVNGTVVARGLVLAEEESATLGVKHLLKATGEVARLLGLEEDAIAGLRSSIGDWYKSANHTSEVPHPTGTGKGFSLN